MADYNKMLIDLLNEKVVKLTVENDSKRKEINRLKRRIIIAEVEEKVLN